MRLREALLGLDCLQRLAHLVSIGHAVNRLFRGESAIQTTDEDGDRVRAGRRHTAVTQND